METMTKPENRSFVRSILGYKWRPGMVSWALHRVTGIGLTLYLFLHVYSLNALVGLRSEAEVTQSFTEMIAHYSSPFFKFAEWTLFGAFLIHGLNGMRIVIYDMAGLRSTTQKRLAYAVAALTVVLLIASAWPMWLGRSVASFTK